MLLASKIQLPEIETFLKTYKTSAEAYTALNAADADAEEDPDQADDGTHSQIGEPKYQLMLVSPFHSTSPLTPLPLTRRVESGGAANGQGLIL